MTSQSTYHYVESSCRLLDDDIDEESLNETVSDNNHKNVSFFQNDDTNLDDDLVENKILHEKRQRKLSYSKEYGQKVSNPSKNGDSVGTLHNIEFAEARKKRRTNSFNEIKISKFHEKNNHQQRSNNSVIDIKSSFKKAINAGKNIIPNTVELAKKFEHSISLQSQKKPVHDSFEPVRYDRSESFNQNIEFDAENETFVNLKLDSKLRDSKNNFLPSEASSDIHQHNHNSFISPSCLVEEGYTLSTSFSQSKSSSPSSSASNKRSINDEEAEISALLDQGQKIFFDENNNLLDGNNTKCELIRLDHLKLTRNNSDSIRMRHNSSKSQLARKVSLKLDKKFLNNNNPLIDNKNCKLVSNLDSPNGSSDNDQVTFSNSNRRQEGCVTKYFVITLLFVVNLLNYIDRYTLAGVLREVQEEFNINDSESGLLQTVFICSYMLLAPLFGFLGDRYPRKWLIVFGITFWSFMTFLGSFVPSDNFLLFLIIRSLVGIGEASYSCVAPTIIGDLFTSELRTKMLAIFYLAVPVGSGMGYIVGSNISKLFGDWRWALRFTPPLGFFCVILLIFFVTEPKRGGAEGSKHDTNQSSIFEDVIYLCKNKTFVWITIGFTFASFVLGGLSWWVPAFVETAIKSRGEEPQQISLLFGVVTCVSGLFGVGASSILAPKLRNVTKKADPIVCAIGSLIAAPTLFILILITRSANQIVYWLIVFVAISSMCLSWTIVADILLYVIHPTKRSIASAFNILICHLFGDAFSPYVIGAISDALRYGKPMTYYNQYTSLQTALYAGPVFAVLSFGGYLFAALYVEEDKKKVELFIKKSQKNSSDPTLANNNEQVNGMSTANPNFGDRAEQHVDNINEKNNHQISYLKDSNDELVDASSSNNLYSPDNEINDINPTV